MSTNPINPYAAPRAAVADETVTRGEFIPGGKGVPPGNGWSWIAAGWGYFKASPGLWIGVIVVLVVLIMVMSVIPFVGSIALSLLMPAFVAGLMLGCRAIDEGRGLEFNHLFAGFQNRFGTLVAVGALSLAATTAIVVVAVVIFGAAVFGLGGANPQAMLLGLLAGLVVVALSIPIAMALWFAPALIVLHELGAVEAMKQSFTGCLRNIVPFLVYGVIGLVLMIVASLPIFLGWLVLGPVLAASVYAAYKDIYLA